MYARIAAEAMKAMWITVPHSSACCEVWCTSTNIWSRWTEEMPTMAVASFTFRTLELTCESHSGWSRWPWSPMRETKVSYPLTITMISRFAIMTTSTSFSTASMTYVSFAWPVTHRRIKFHSSLKNL